MYAVEFSTELRDGLMLQIPPEGAARLPKTGKIRVIILMENREAAYEQIPSEDHQKLAIPKVGVP